MKTEDFNYYLDDKLIAQHPSKKRDESRLMIVDRDKAKIEEKIFKDIIDYLRPGDLLVMNDTRVIPARFFGYREDKEEKIEVFLYQELGDDYWECLVRPGRKMKLGTKIFFGQGQLMGQVEEITESGSRRIRFSHKQPMEELMDLLGQIPLPPYITEKLEDSERYQTVYSKNRGSVAAPTSGFHFTNALLDEIKQKGIELASLTLHVGLGTFRPVSADNIHEHKMHSEFYTIPQETVVAINRAKNEGRRVIAIGTTTTRTLEAAASSGELVAGSSWTDIFIYPGFKFKVIDGLVTNFHLPKSTLLMLVSAFAGRDLIMEAYRQAVEDQYRFFSFGDAMFIY